MSTDGAPIATRLDCRGLLCPLPALETRRALGSLEAGDLLEVLCTDPASEIDLRALCDETGDELVEAWTLSAVYHFRIRKG